MLLLPLLPHCCFDGVVYRNNLEFAGRSCAFWGWRSWFHSVDMAFMLTIGCRDNLPRQGVVPPCCKRYGHMLLVISWSLTLASCRGGQSAWLRAEDSAASRLEFFFSFSVTPIFLSFSRLGALPCYRRCRSPLPTVAHRRCRPTITQVEKLRMLSVVSLAHTCKIVKYSALKAALGMDNVRHLEDLIFDTMYSGLLQGKLDQRQEVLKVYISAEDCKAVRLRLFMRTA